MVTERIVPANTMSARFIPTSDVGTLAVEFTDEDGTPIPIPNDCGFLLGYQDISSGGSMFSMVEVTNDGLGGIFVDRKEMLTEVPEYAQLIGEYWSGNDNALPAGYCNFVWSADPLVTRRVKIKCPTVLNSWAIGHIRTNGSILTLHGGSDYVFDGPPASAGLDAPALRAALGMAAPNLDAQLTGIADGVAAIAAPEVVIDAADLIAGGLASDASVQALRTQLTQAISTGAAAVAYPAPGGGSARYISAALEDVWAALRDPAHNAYKPDLMAVYLNRAINDVGELLVQLGADLGFGRLSIIGDGASQNYALPADFRAFVPGQLRPRSPEKAVTNYRSGAGLDHVDQLDVPEQPLSVGGPTQFCLASDGVTQYVKFSSIPAAGAIFDALYLPVYQRFTVNDFAGERMPFMGLLDSLICRTVELYAREGLEFTVDAREVWRARSEAEVSRLLGLRHLQTNTMVPSLWRKGGARR
jgi:hypothetical protein